MTSPQSNWLKKHPVAVYLILSYGWTWLCWIPTLLIAQQRGYVLPATSEFIRLVRSGFDDSLHLVLALIFSAAVYGPLLAALVVTALETGKAGLGDLFRRIVKWRVALRWYGWVVLIPLILSIVPVALAALVGLAKWDFAGLGALLPFLLPMLLVQLLTSGLGEEPGWRGFLYPRLCASTTVDKSIWRVGLFWAIWHYPFTIYYTLSGMPSDVPFVGLIMTLVMSLAGQTMSLIGMTYIYAWLYNHTGSVWLSIIFHALSNVATVIFVAEVSPTVSLMIAAMPWLIVLILEKTVGKPDFPGQPA